MALASWLADPSGASLRRLPGRREPALMQVAGAARDPPCVHGMAGVRLAEGGAVEPFIDLVGEANELRTAASHGLLLGIEEPHP
jgi:hypothetical protein